MGRLAGLGTSRFARSLSRELSGLIQVFSLCSKHIKTDRLSTKNDLRCIACTIGTAPSGGLMFAARGGFVRACVQSDDSSRHARCVYPTQRLPCVLLRTKQKLPIIHAVCF